MARNLNLSSSLRPLLLFFRCIGIHFPDEEKDPSLKLSKLSKWKSVHAGICFVLNLSSQVATLFFIFNKIFLFEMIGQESVDTITSATLLAIDYTNYALAPAICHFIVLTIVRPRWTVIIKSFSHLENQLVPQFYVKLRRITLVGLSFIIILVKLQC